jgi:hypothetical protein
VLPENQVIDQCSLHAAESRLAVLGKDLCDRRATVCLEEMVGVEELPLQLAGKKSANRGFAGAHESHKDNTRDMRG